MRENKKLNILGLRYDKAPIEIREKLYFRDTQIVSFSDILMDKGLDEAVILMTCNRVEIFTLSDLNIDSVKLVKDSLFEFFNVTIENELIFNLSGDDALRHLFYLAMGLDSMLVGEDQILGQVKDAWQTAMDIGTAKKYLNKFFREAVTFAKMTKSKSDITKKPINLSYLGIKTLSEYTQIDNKKALIIGAGEMSKLAILDLIEKNANITVCNRTIANSEKFKELDDTIIIKPYDMIETELQDADIVVVATSAPHFILNKQMIKKRNKALFILDLGMPRDVNSNVLEIDKVTLLNLDDLKNISDENMRQRQDILNSFKGQVEDKILEVNTWIQNLDFDLITETLNQRCDEIAQETLSYIFRKTNLTSHEKFKVEKIVRSAIKRSAKTPIVSAKSIQDPQKRQNAINLLEELM